MTKLTHTPNGQSIPKHLKVYRDDNTGAFRLHYKLMLWPLCVFTCILMILAIVLDSKIPVSNAESAIPTIVAFAVLAVLADIMYTKVIAIEYGKIQLSHRIFGLETRGHTISLYTGTAIWIDTISDNEGFDSEYVYVMVYGVRKRVCSGMKTTCRHDAHEIICDLICTCNPHIQFHYAPPKQHKKNQ